MPTPRPDVAPCGHAPAECPCWDRLIAILRAVQAEQAAQP